MKQEDKKLLLIDLSARLSYHVICSNGEEDLELVKIDIINEKVYLFSESFLEFDISKVKPYLRPMSSMTKEEREEIEVLIFGEWYNGGSCKVDHEGWIEILADYDVSGIDPGFCSDYTDYLLEHHFDFRGLIPKGLALKK